MLRPQLTYRRRHPLSIGGSRSEGQTSIPYARPRRPQIVFIVHAVGQHLVRNLGHARLQAALEVIDDGHGLFVAGKQSNGGAYRGQKAPRSSEAKRLGSVSERRLRSMMARALIGDTCRLNASSEVHAAGSACPAVIAAGVPSAGAQAKNRVLRRAQASITGSGGRRMTPPAPALRCAAAWPLGPASCSPTTGGSRQATYSRPCRSRLRYSVEGSTPSALAAESSVG